MNHYLVTFAKLESPFHPGSTMVFQAVNAEDALTFARTNFVEQNQGIKDGKPIPVFKVLAIQAYPLKTRGKDYSSL